MASAAARADAPADTTVGELVVVAEKTSERITDVAINVTSVSGETIQQAHVSQAADLMMLTPNLDVKDNIPGAQSIITVRGVGLDDFSSTNNSSVGVYVDDVFLASFAEMDFHFYDLDHLEVLKGPQGTLYGRNSTAGAINILSARPSTKGTSGELTAGYGNYNAFTANGFVNIPVSDSFALRFSGMTQQQGRGYWFSRVLNTDMGRQNNLLGRAQALWTPNAKTTVLLKIEGEHDRSGIGVGKFFGTVPVAGYAGACPNFAAPANCTDFHNYTDVTPNPFQGDWNHPAPYNVDQLNATLHIDSDLTWAKLSSITGYITFRREFYIDADAAPTQQAEFDQHDDVNQFSQEVRLNGDVHRLEWMVGGYYSWDKVHSFTPGVVSINFSPFPDPNSFFVGSNVFIHSDQTTTSGAVFGRLKYPLTDQFALEGGLRYTTESRSYIGGTQDVTPKPGVSICTFLTGCAVTPANLTFLNASIHDENWSWRGALDWKPGHDVLIYASVSRGEKSGGFFNGITTTNLALAPYKPEQLTDYEVGFNALLLDRRLQVESSVFYYDYFDLQAQTFTNVGGIGLIKLGNIPHAAIYGADINVTARPVEGLTLRAGLGLLHSRLGAFETTVPIAAGNKLPDAPEISFNGTARYEHALGDHLVGAIQVSPQYSGAVFKEALNTPFLSAAAYWVIDARASLSTADGGWEVALWGRNIGNTRYVAQATNDALGMGYRIFNAPATYGVEISHKFK
ncbi:MAG: TonB-dependent receptor [Caulobacterales bacterium]